MTDLFLCPITREQANAFIAKHHRHHGPVVGDIIRVALADDGLTRLVAVAVAGRPVARQLQDGWSIEVTRLCVADEVPPALNAASRLYGAVCRAAQALGYHRAYTYILAGEPGTSLRAAGFAFDGYVRGASWHRDNRPRDDKHPTTDKERWKRILAPHQITTPPPAIDFEAEAGQERLL